MKRTIIIAVNVVIFWIALPLGLFSIAHRLDDGLSLDGGVPLLFQLLGLPLIPAGCAIAVLSVLALHNEGKGLPISALPPTRYVTTGPYRYWRHPIYTGYAAAMVGLGLLFDSPSMALLVVPGFYVLWHLTWVRLYEEPGLYRRFGQDYRAHRLHTGLVLPFSLRRAGRAVVLWLVQRVFNVRVEGKHNVPEQGPVIILHDHHNYLDFVFGQLCTDRPIVIPVTAESNRKPLGRAFIRLMGGVPRRRYSADPAGSMQLEDRFVAGEVLGISIEAERSWSGELQPFPPHVVRSLGKFDCPVVPAAFVGTHRHWPRWADGMDRGAPVTVRLGEPFLIREVVEGLTPSDPEFVERLTGEIRERIVALRDPDETSVDLTRVKRPRPELALWRCPICRDEECLGMDGKHWLVCRSCDARWDTRNGDLTQDWPEEDAGLRQTIAEWAAQAGTEPDLDLPEPYIVSQETTWLEDRHAGGWLGPLHRIGCGEVRLFADRIEWTGGDGAERTVPLAAIRTVTTERNDVLQLGIGKGVAQLVFAQASPLRWQRYVETLRG